MILTDKEIRDLCEKNDMISPFKEEALQSESYDLGIGDMVYVTDKNLRELDLKNEDTLNRLYKEYNIPDEGFLLKPKECVLVSLKEVLNIPENINAHIRPRTRFIRAGLEISSQQLNSTYHGILKIRLSNFLDVPIRIYKGLKICQIIFEELKEVPTKEKQYKNKKNATYQNEKEFRGPKLDPELQKKADEIVRQLLGD
ncbi:deoxycytidine triphosphate deaminase [Fusobacterium animalis F0419]|uniref:Deoxycytidine triphosphate deaminase n=1 Tax=Fusobacterium animalis F0419 TaxID=999414 RepID=H1HFR1_9FUSO|nr:dCTP deaminase [Fusobacterium animalis]EHO77584.1 deoxycytidine triphosphate deaminase [Fusobacterium animalis F0419]